MRCRPYRDEPTMGRCSVDIDEYTCRRCARILRVRGHWALLSMPVAESRAGHIVLIGWTRYLPDSAGDDTLTCLLPCGVYPRSDHPCPDWWIERI